MSTAPLVVIHCLAYNQIHFIKQCLDGIVMQQTTFPFYAVVHDDASTDGTAEIIRQYADKYQNIIHPILETENLWSKPNGSLDLVMTKACADAKYLAYCEGDDYWTDPLKLQKQVDFMESHPDFSICYHNVYILNDDTHTFDTSDIINDGIPDFPTITDLLERNFIHTPSVLYRFNPRIQHKLVEMGRSTVKDYARNLFYAEHGKICRLSDRMAVYRHGVGVWMNTNSDTQRQLLWLICLSKTIPLIDNPSTREGIERKICELQKYIVEEYTKALDNLQSTRNSKAFKLGKILLSPTTWIKR